MCYNLLHFLKRIPTIVIVKMKLQGILLTIFLFALVQVQATPVMWGGDGVMKGSGGGIGNIYRDGGLTKRDSKRSV